MSANQKIGGAIFFCQDNSSPSAGTPSGSPISTASASSSSSSLSTGAKAGIGVGVALGVLLILGGVLAFWFRKRRAPHSPTPVVSSASGPSEIAPSKSGNLGLSEIEGDQSWGQQQGLKSKIEKQELAA